MTANKAIIGAVLAAVTVFIASVQGRPTADSLGAIDWIIVVLSALAAGLAVYVTPNRPT